VIPVVEHALLGLSVAALLGAALRVAALTGAGGIDRVLAAAPLAAAAAIIEALVLGLAGLGGTSLALAGAAAITWLAARLALPTPEPQPLEHLRRWWRGLSPAARAMVGACAALLAAYGAFLMRFPAFGDDGLNYHFPAAAGWVQSGHTGAVVSYFDDLPTGNYPITDEVLVAWAAGLSHSLVVVTLWPLAQVVLLALAGWRGLRLLRVPAPAAALGVAALLTSPIIVTQAIGPNTDLPATAWLVTCAALCAGSRRHPALLATALVAAGLAVGVKTTAAAPALAALAAGAWMARGQIRPLVWPLAAGAVAAAVVGLSWYVRNTITHGAPLWPLATTSFGDPVPFVLRQIDGRLIGDLGSIGPRAGGYAGQLGGGLVLLLGAAAAPLIGRWRAVAVAAAVALACVLVWTSAPYTGYPRDEAFDFPATNAVRYLLPSLAAAVLALGLAARREGVPRWVATALLAAAVGWNVERDVALGFPFLPSALMLVVAAALGALAGVAAGGASSLPLPRPALTILVAAGAGALLAIPAHGFLQRHLRVTAFAPGAVRWIAAHPAFDDGSQPVWGVGTVDGSLVGDRLRHEVALLPRREPCPALLARVRRGWVVLPRLQIRPALRAPPASLRRQGRLRACLSRLAPVYGDAVHEVYGPARGG